MHDTLNLEHIQARPYGPEAERTRFDPEFKDPVRLYVPEQRQSSEMFTRSTHLEVVANTQKAAELAAPADMFMVPQTPEENAANQKAYVDALTDTPANVESLEDRRYASPEAAINEAVRAGLAFENVRNAE